jgi:hypothetical protein
MTDQTVDAEAFNAFEAAGWEKQAMSTPTTEAPRSAALAAT